MCVMLLFLKGLLGWGLGSPRQCYLRAAIYHNLVPLTSSGLVSGCPARDPGASH